MNLCLFELRKAEMHTYICREMCQIKWIKSIAKFTTPCIKVSDI